MRKRLLLLCVVGIILFLAAGDDVGETTVTAPASGDQSHALSYTEHSPIVITSNADFETQGWPGNGTEDNPYLIEGLKISSSDTCITIKDTTVHFEINDCIITAPSEGSSHGIVIENATNGIIQDSIIDLHSYGVYLSNTLNNTLRNNMATGNLMGFRLFDSTNCKIINSTAAGNSHTGFRLWFTENCTVTNCSASNNPDDGLRLSQSVNCQLTNNTFVNNGLSVSGSSISEWLHTMSGNIVNGKPLGYFKHQLGTSINGRSYGQLILANCSEVTLEDGQIYNATRGFEIGHSTNCTVSNNTASHTEIGFYLAYSSNCTVTNNTADDNSVGFWLRNSDNLTLKKNIASNNLYNGFELDDSDNSVLRNNTAPNSDYGFNLYGSDYTRLAYNYATHNSKSAYLLSYSENCKLINNTATDSSAGLRLSCSSNCTVVNNTLVNDGFEISGSLTQWLHTISGNTVNGRPLGYFKHLVKTSIDSSSYGQVIIANCSEVIVQDGLIEDTTSGFQIGHSTDCIMKNNTATNNIKGFYLEYCDNCTIMNNSATNNSRGFRLLDSTNCKIINSTATNNGDGLELWYSGYCKIINNSATDNHDGISLFHSTNCTIANNLVGGNSYGIYLASSSNNTIVTNTVISSSDNGIYIKRQSCTNHIYHNAVWDNDENAYDDGSSNVWDDGIGFGNYWGDFTSGDTYSIGGPAGSVDRYPYPIDAYHSVALDHPDNVEYEHGTAGHNIKWHPSDPYPESYDILQNGTLVDAGIWNDSEISIRVDGLDVGVYNYTLVVSDASDNIARDMVLVTVVDTTAPSIDCPDDIEYEEGTTGHAITWNAVDLNPASYQLYRNGSIVESGTWNGSKIILDVDGLDVGVHNYTIVVSDSSGNFTSDTVFVTVTPSDTTTTTTPSVLDPIPLIATACAVVGIAAIAMLLYIKRRK